MCLHSTYSLFNHQAMDDFWTHKNDLLLETLWTHSKWLKTDAIRQLYDYYVPKMVLIAYRYLQNSDASVSLALEVFGDILTRSREHKDGIGEKMMLATQEACIILLASKKIEIYPPN